MNEFLAYAPHESNYWKKFWAEIKAYREKDDGLKDERNGIIESLMHGVNDSTGYATINTQSAVTITKAIEAYIEKKINETIVK